LIILAVALSGITGGLLWLSWLSGRRWGCEGTLYFNDSGESHGGFEMAAQWNVTLSIIWDQMLRPPHIGTGILVVTPDPHQLGNDALKKWIYTVNGFLIDGESCVMALDGHPLTLRWVDNDTIWNQFDNQFITTTPDLDPTVFPGFLGHYYVELRLAPASWPRTLGCPF
jgi:hypothetical protein